jgi:tetratricopeptide (TPR) repeat protein
MLSFGWAVFGMVLLAFGVRLAYLYQIELMPFFYHPVGDAAAYWSWADRILAGDWLGHEPFYQAPAYPYFLAVVRGMVGDDPWRVRIMQAALGALSCGLLALAGRWFMSRGAGLAAGVIAAVYGPAIFYDGLIQKAGLSFALMAGLLALLGWMAREEGTKGRRDEGTEGEAGKRQEARGKRGATAPRSLLLVAFVVGLVLGLLALAQEQALLLGVVVLAWMTARGDALYILYHAGAPRHAAATTGWSAWVPLAGLLGVTMVLGSVAYRNHRVCGEASLTTFQSGPNFYIGNHAGATGRYVALKRGHETPVFERHDATELAEAAAGSRLSPRAVSAYWWAQAGAFIRQHPLSWLRLLAYKGLLVWNAYEIPDTESYTLYAHLSWLLSVCGGLVHFGVLGPLAAVGLWATRRRCYAPGLLYGMLVMLTVGVAAFYVMGRYRYPLVPILVLFAGAGLVELRRVLLGLGARGTATGGSAPRTRPAIFVVLIVVTAVATNLRINPEQRLDGMAYANLGVALAEQEQLDEAIVFFQQALERVPDAVETHYNLGVAYRLKGSCREALVHLRQAQALDPGLIAVDTQMALCYETLGLRAEALQHYERALAIDPADEQARSGVERLR